jgi:GT2 family glycosyltransferase
MEPESPGAPTVHVVLVTLNGWEDTRSCLHALQKQTYPRVQLHLVDNASTDGTVEKVRREFPNVTVYPQQQNLGFAAGCNVALRVARQQGGYALLLNNDTCFGPTLVECLVDHVRNAPDAGLLAPRINFAEPETMVWSTGYGQNRLTLEKQGGHDGQPEQSVPGSPIEREYLLGTALLISPDVLREVGLLDERFFFTYEDLDYSIRTRQAGFRLLCIPNAVVWHKVSGTAGQDSPLQNYHLGYASVLFFRKHYRLAQPLVILLNRAASALRRTTRLLLSRKPRTAIAYWRGLLRGLRT